MEFTNETAQTDLKNLVKNSHKITFLTGAGVSTDSGIPDFKTTDKNWKHDFSREQATSMHFFKRDPKAFWEIYRELFESKSKSEPNRFHRWITSLESDHDVTVLTQNVDGLHSAAGNSTVLEIHGSTRRVVCMNPTCKKLFPAENFRLFSVPTCPDCGKILKPDVCLFDEGVKRFVEASEIVIASDLLIVAGTSLDVGPFNTLPRIAEQSKGRINILWVNQVEPPYGYKFTHNYIGSLKNFLKVVKDKDVNVLLNDIR